MIKRTLLQSQKLYIWPQELCNSRLYISVNDQNRPRKSSTASRHSRRSQSKWQPHHTALYGNSHTHRQVHITRSNLPPSSVTCVTLSNTKVKVNLKPHPVEAPAHISYLTHQRVYIADSAVSERIATRSGNCCPSFRRALAGRVRSVYMLFELGSTRDLHE